MIYAAMVGHADIVRLLAEQKADLDAEDNDGKELGEINSDGETGKEGGEGKRIKFQRIHFCYCF